MRKYLYYFIILLILFLLQTAGQKVFIREVQFVPQLVLLFLIAAALRSNLKEVIWFAFLAGFFSELFSSLFFGAFIFSLILTGAIIYASRNLTSGQSSLPSVIFWVGISSLVFPLFVYSYHSMFALMNFANPLSIQDFYSQGIIWTILVNIGFFYPVRAVFKFLPA